MGMEDLRRVAEIGPGDSLGIGLAALLSGSKEYYAFDVIKHANLDKNLSVAEEIASLFISKKEIPHCGSQYKNTNPALNDYRFPNECFGHQIEQPEIMESLSELKKALKHQSGLIKIEYRVPWYEKIPSALGDLDLVYSQAVMEHVENIQHAYDSMWKWLKPGGIISHQIDFKAHEMTKEWNGHWLIGQRLWKFLMHGRKYSINRLPMSAHVEAITRAGFEIHKIIPVRRATIYGLKTVKVRGYEFTDEDMVTSSALIQAIKPTH